MELATFLIKAGLVSIVGGIFAWLLSMILNPVIAFGIIGETAIGLVLVFILLGMSIKYKNEIKITAASLFQTVMLFFIIGLIGTLITTFIPIAGIANFILSINFTILGILWTFFYIMLIELLLAKVFKMKS